MELLIILGLIVGAVLFFIVIYNRLIALREKRKNAFSDIDVQLKQRHDLIPNLVNVVKGYAAHEKSVLENLTEARSNAMRQSTIDSKAAAETGLGAAMMRLFAVAENYPDLKADQNFQRLQAELSDIENKIAAARRFFNNATNELNTAIQQFPAVLIARPFGFKEENFFEMTTEEKQMAEKPPEVQF